MADSQIHVALAGNPNCGKTTLFNLITGANGYVGNWPGVTVEKKEAKLLSDKNVTITDLPGIYSLSPYSPEEQCSRDYLMSGEPDVVVQVVDATNLERNLYLALQVIETGLPVVVALNMADLVEKNGDKIDTDKLSKKLGCPVMMISALKNKGIKELFEQVKKSAASKGQVPEHKFDSSIEDVLDHIENNLPASVATTRSNCLSATRTPASSSTSPRRRPLASKSWSLSASRIAMTTPSPSSPVSAMASSRTSLTSVSPRLRQR